MQQLSVNCSFLKEWLVEKVALVKLSILTKLISHISHSTTQISVDGLSFSLQIVLSISNLTQEAADDI